MDFRVLGTLEVWSGAERIAVDSPRHQRVLAALVLAPRTVVSISRLVEAVWAERPPATAGKQVQNCVSALRDRLGGGGLITTDGPGYRLAVADEQLDWLRFRQGVDAARTLACQDRPADAVDALKAALALWRGPALDGAGSPALAARAALLDEQRLDAVELCAQWQLALGRYREVVDELSAYAVEHPLRERTHARLMLALDRCGRKSDALTVFTGLRTRLADELGVDPGPEARHAHLAVLRADRPGDPEVRHAHLAVLPADEPGVDPEIRPAHLAVLHDDPADAETSSLDVPAPFDLPADPLSRAADDLAAAIARQWTAEAELRSLNQPEPVRVRWSTTPRPVTAGHRAPGAPEVLRGDLSDVVAKFRTVPTGQLVILGEPGAGKTVLAILLTLGLLADRTPDQPVPVLLPLASWNPREEHLLTWLARRLLEEYPGLGNTDAYGPDAATRLVVEGHVLPVLDGLDETPAELHTTAVDALDRAGTSTPALVLTSRWLEYERVVRESGTLLARASVVEIEPVTPDDAAAFLTARAPAGETRWQPVVDRLSRDPGGPLARALRTPLMVNLARTAYASPESRPEELCGFDDTGELEGHLLDAYLPTVYAERPAHPSGHPNAPRYEPRQAQRWLTFLADHLRRQRTRDLAWWRLDRALPAGVLGLLPAVVFAVTGWVVGGVRVALVYGLSFGLAGVVAHAFGARPGPLRVEFRLRGTGAKFGSRFGVGVAIGVGVGLAWSLSPGVILVLALVFGFGIGGHSRLATPAEVGRATTPASLLRMDRNAALSFTVSFALCLGLFYGLAFAYTRELRFTALWGGRFDIVIALVGGFAAAMLGRFLLGRLGSIAYGLAGALVGGQVFPRAQEPADAIAAGMLFGVAVGLSVCLSRAWGSWCVSRLWLAADGHTPMRLMAFLDDAHRRGVLRQVGAVYQFRHARLQDRLAGGPSERKRPRR
ncbi:BTAD domain-containing putative transcriptional regulator [Actinosynnema sp. CS-041913]|uniref:BTAD domain-containing putative transcriptional regulator n=1 Tax=Actinosynnema sp. CS-041913 TaxID=3239917 RepID=UPI003D8C1179